MTLHNIEFSTPFWLSVVWTLTGCLTVISGAFGFYVIWLKSPKGMTQYKHTLSAIMLATSGFDLMLNFVLRPVALFPLWGGFSDSELAKLLGQVMGAVGLLEGDASYLAVPRMYAVGAFFHVVTAFPSAICLALARSPRHKMIEYILQKRPEFSAIINHTQWVIYDPGIDAGNDWSHRFAYVYAGSICAYTVAGALCSVLIVRTMNRMKQHMSEKTYKLHKNLLVALCWQSAIPVVMYLVPLFFGVIVIYLDLEGDYQGGTHVLFAIMGLHSTLNVVLMTYFTTPYRLFAVDLLYHIGVFRKNETTVQVAQFSTSVSSAIT